MKKFLLCIMILILPILLVGCGKKADIYDYFSEITYVYYNGISTDGQMSASISVGEREEPYLIDGKHWKNTDFSLLVIRFHFAVKDDIITVDFYSGQEKLTVILEYNPLNCTYMADLGFALGDDRDYSVKYQNYALDFSKVSDISYQDAIEKSLDVLSDKVDDYYNGGSFSGECYLKVLSKPDGDFQDLYWLFTIVGQNDRANNVVIDVKDGSIVLVN